MAMDADGDGCVSFDESLAAWQADPAARSPPTAEDTKKMEELLTKMHETIDKDGSRCVTLAEVQEHMESRA